MSREEKLKARHELLLTEERCIWQTGKLAAGLDEAGAGPLAGPVVAACVIVNPDAHDALMGVYDSKQLSGKRRAALFETIKQHALAVSVGMAAPEEIDRINVFQASVLAMRRAYGHVPSDLRARLGGILIDGPHRHLDSVQVVQVNLTKGDSRSLSIAASSIVAKEVRDSLMADYSAVWPAYGFEKNKGYGTPEHLAALAEHGPCPIHRKSFAPIKGAAGA